MISQVCTYVQEYYKVPACIGRRVIAYGKPGVITADRGHYIGVTLECDSKRRISNYHPTDGIVYGDMADKLPKQPRQTNYDKFQNDDIDCDFHEWLGINKPRFETRGKWPKYEHRMYRRATSGDGDGGYCHYRDIQGDWAPTMKAAKASYKAQLKNYHDGLRALKND